MAWMRKARVQALNNLLQQLREKHQMSHAEAVRYLMNLTMMSRITVERYIQDLIFMGRIAENKGKIQLVAPK